ncbi:long-chain fatty acid--CoA ligase [Leptospira sp. 2 VSF19]|uniref:Long-chain fatty acid--CoA ligase n=1 Tax=Leptospira soteropolitanensis TaxID=2950025 RepID=A0AAW5VEG4_9LEPT|nr:long-chain fatty acid--CoA ligase [Leptospira soteropolitanensis]MCW7492011.1 long-chain fatty acid--CoA ligase [Leptospira soteropolitanensis]MCW7499593.1 long-chain fatty acid--CoA ligase [Leptospira soteropolitanensis]MCW7521844.1 long-chain fatty acid--CoA ligase [Leptospira soteropolitanensis]MCW7525698.1 long-chain fatty acid--CoA ligase [Leptospira soteropolitanensis]MCW7530188.1 long-chain fatty acid--CoA ligase [Leptospira soteropolitanensis]
MKNFTTLNDVFYYANRAYGAKEMFFGKDSQKNFFGRTFSDIFHKSENLSLSLLQMGLQPGDRIGLMADNRTEWAIADIATLLNGAVNVPRGSDSTPQEIEYILSHSESKYCFVEHEKLYESLKPVLSNTKVEKVIILDPGFRTSDNFAIPMDTLIKDGEALRKNLPSLELRSKQVKPDDLFTIIYTSGTTGMPKGVMLTHQNMVYNVVQVPPRVGLKTSDRTLSILPVWHIFERAIDYAIIAEGASIAYTNIRDLRDDFQKIKPTFMASAPRLWENLYLGIKQKLEKAPENKRKLFDFAYDVCKKFKDGQDYLSGNKLLTKEESPFERAKNTAVSLGSVLNLFLLAKVLDGLVFSKIRDVLGGHLTGTISGGGALPAHVDEFFNVIGIPVYEGYGMTECAPIISVRSVGKVVQGSVGKWPDGTAVRIVNDQGESVPKGKMGIIHIKGPQVMKGYYKNEEATSKAIQDGWMNTGDLGFISFNDTLSVRGRVKDTIVLLGGENVEPVPIENLLLENSLINQVIVVGQDQKSLTALIWPDKDRMKEIGLQTKDGEDLNQNKEVRLYFQNLIKKQISSENGFKSFEKLSDFRFLPKAMEVGEELTNLFKMKRNVIHDKYKDLIKSMYN